MRARRRMMGLGPGGPRERGASLASVVVVGGGVAGLTCAWRLRREGHEVEVLEAALVPGGRMRSEPHDGFRLERGAQVVTSGYENLLGVARGVGLAASRRDIEPAGEAVLRDGRLHPVDMAAPWKVVRSPLLSARGKAGLARLGVELARRFRRLDPLRPQRAAALDTTDLATGFRRIAGEEATDWLLAPCFSATFDAEPEDLSYAFGLLALRLLATGSTVQTFDGGLGSLTRALAARVPVRTGCEVLAVETETAGVRVRYRTQLRERSVFADAAVVAVPGCAVAALCPKLTPEERGFFEGVRYVRGAIVHLLLERPPPSLRGLQGVAFPRAEGLDLYGLCADHHKPGAAPPGAGLVNVALSEPAARRLWQAPDATLAQHALEQLSLTPIGALAPVGFAVHRWASMLPRFEPGYLARLARFLSRLDRAPRLSFAGDYLVGPTAEGAVVSGLRAASEVASQL